MLRRGSGKRRHEMQRKSDRKEGVTFQSREKRRADESDSSQQIDSKATSILTDSETAI